MYTDHVTVQVQSRIQGPYGIKLKVGQIIALEDSAYVRVMLKSGAVALIDPPSLDPQYLKANGLLRAGEVVEDLPKVSPEPKKEEPKVEAPKKEAAFSQASSSFRAAQKVSEEKASKDTEESE